MKVELEQGVWLADGEGDPPRTLKQEHAKDFNTLRDAMIALNQARLNRPFPDALVHDNITEVIGNIHTKAGGTESNKD